jgi:formate dehydrogenase major subunit
VCLTEVNGNSRLVRACATQVNDGMEVVTRSPRIDSARRAALELLLGDHTGDCVAPCTLNCPAQTRCQAYVKLLAQGEYDHAIAVIMEKIPLPASIGRVCPHPCETACRRQFAEEPVSIAALKAFAAGHGTYKPEFAPATGKRVAIIGGGPGGLTAAYFLRLAGHGICIYEAMPKPGGMLRYGIPEYRLPKAVLDKEIELIESLGVEIRCNEKLAGDDELSRLLRNFDAVVVATGAWRGMKTGVSGEDLPGVTDGIAFLREVALTGEYNVGERVAVVGGGNTAMDACRTAVRLGAKEVTVIYRRAIEEMPAQKLEIEEAEEEGVIFKTLCNPSEIFGNTKVTGVRLQKQEPGPPDESGRRAPVPVDEFEELAVDTVILAVGQRLEDSGFTSLGKTQRGNFAVDELTFSTNQPGVFAIGDAVNKGADIAVNAIAHGEKAARAIDAYLKGVNLPYKPPVLSRRGIKGRADIPEVGSFPREIPRVQSAKTRKNSFSEYVSLLTPEQVKNESARCLECGCSAYEKCKLIANANEYLSPEIIITGKHHTSEIKQISNHIRFDRGKCVLCGLCVRICAEHEGKIALGFVGRGFDTAISPAFGLPLEQSDCNNCQKCVENCPTGAMTCLDCTVFETL